MLILLCNCAPYLSPNDDVLAQFCLISLSFAMAVGILEKTSEEFQDEIFGILLVLCTALNVAVGIFVIAHDLIVVTFPVETETMKKRVISSTLVGSTKRLTNKLLGSSERIRTNKHTIQSASGLLEGRELKKGRRQCSFVAPLNSGISERDGQATRSDFRLKSKFQNKIVPANRIERSLPKIQEAPDDSGGSSQSSRGKTDIKVPLVRQVSSVQRLSLLHGDILGD